MATQEVENIISNLEKANSAFSKQVLNVEDNFVKSAIKAQRKLLDDMSEILLEAPDFKNISVSQRLAWYAGQTNRINSMLRESGYIDFTSEYVDQYKEFARLAQETFRAAGWDAGFANIPKEYINFLQNNDMKYFKFLGNEAMNKIDKTIFEMSIGGYNRTAMLSELKGVITGAYEWGDKQGLYEWHAGTYVRTQASKVQQEFMNVQAETVDAKHFTYLGPADSKTRPFCAARVGGVYTKEEILQMDNGQTGDVFTERGGWNCRHQWIAVPDEVARGIAKAA